MVAEMGGTLDHGFAEHEGDSEAGDEAGQKQCGTLERDPPPVTGSTPTETRWPRWDAQQSQASTSTTA